MTISAGTIIPYGGSSAPSGFLLCDGSAVSRTTYSTLFGVISTTFGSGDGSTTFNVPDLRGRVVAGKDNMGGSAASRLTGTTMSPDGNTLGATGGEQTHTLTTGELASHTHTASVTDPGHHHDLWGSNANANNNYAGFGQSFITGVMGEVGTASGGTPAAYTNAGAGHQLVIDSTTGTTVSNATAGSGTAHNNVQPTLILNYIIATVDTAAGTGTVTSVAMTGDGVIFNSTVSGSPVTTSGTLAPSLLTQTANTVLAGPTSGGAATPTFRALVGADLPNPSSSTLGGIQSLAAVSHKWINEISTAGVPSAIQPDFSDLSGSVQVTQMAYPDYISYTFFGGV
jgi:microcystin-dependent protein